MNQQINLYLPEFRIKKDKLTAVLMGQVAGAVIGIMLLVSAVDYFRAWSLSAEADSLRAALQQETQRTNQLDEQLARRSQNVELTQRLELAELRLESSIQIRDFLSETQLGNVDGFSEYFKDLSRAAFDGISVTEFAFANGGRQVRMSGQALDSAMVPRYVDNIEMGKSPLRLQRFSPSIRRDSSNDQIFQFELVTNGE